MSNNEDIQRTLGRMEGGQEQILREMRAIYDRLGEHLRDDAEKFERLITASALANQQQQADANRIAALETSRAEDARHLRSLSVRRKILDFGNSAGLWAGGISLATAILGLLKGFIQIKFP